MPIITSTSVTPQPPTAPTSILAADVNAQFQQIVVASADVDADNIRSEGIDIRQLTGTSPILKTAQYRYNNLDVNATVPFVIGTGLGGNLSANMPAGRPAVFLDYGALGFASHIEYGVNEPLVLNQFNLLRFHYSFLVDSIQLNGLTANYPIDVNDTFNCNIMFPTYWVLGQTGIAAANIFPGRVDWFSYGMTVPATIPQTDPPSIGVGDEALLDDGICLMDFAGEESTLGITTNPRRRLHGCLNYVHQDLAPLSITKLGVCVTGKMKFHHLVAPGFDTRCFIQPNPDLAPVYPMTLNMAQANLAAIVLHKGYKP